MAETATRRRNGTAPKDEATAKPKNGRSRSAAAKPKAAAAGGATKNKTRPARKPGPAKPPSKATASGSRRRGDASAKSGGSSRRKPASAVKRTAKKAVDAVEDVTPSVSAVRHPVRKLALVGLKKMAKAAFSRVADAGADAIRAAADRAAATGHEAVEKAAHKRLPIQRSVDVAVPLRVAWEEWIALDFIPEGVHTVSDIERDGTELRGRTSGAKSSSWAAEILDERPEQSFAWQSHEGSDCAGLITFHELSRRLTRVELNLDVVPTGPLETAQLATKLADRRAENELRRFKARLELINPDLYEEDDEPDEDEPDESDEPEETEETDDQSEDEEAA